MIKYPRRFTLFIILSVFLLTIICCDRPSKVWEKMDKAENLMQSKPDSALAILDSIAESDLKGKKEAARYALLKSIALDKNYIDTTTFDVLQPAIDYYLENGTADEKLKTLFYQGVIFLNRNDYDMAMDCYLKANDLKNECKDTLTYANMLVAQGNTYAKSMQIRDYVNNNLRASQLYNSIGEQQRLCKSMIRALDGSISLGDKVRSDSILAITETFVKQYPDFEEDLVRVKMTYAIRFDSDSVINNLLSSMDVLTNYDDETKLDLTLAYLKVRDGKKAKTVFESIDPHNPGLNVFRYISIRPSVLEENQEYHAALEAYKKFYLTMEEEKSKIYLQKTTVAEDIHQLKIDHLNSIQLKDRQIWLGLCMGLVLCIIIGIIYFQLRIGKKNRIISEQEHSRVLLENENLQKQNSVLELEKHNADLELEKKNLVTENMQLKISQLESEKQKADLELEKKNLLTENMQLKISQLESEKQKADLELEKKNIATENMQLKISQLESEKQKADLELEKKNLLTENMQLKISQLESEGERLKELLEESKLSKPILDSIQERIGILNGLLAAKIADNPSYSKPYDKWINKVTEDRKCFMNTTRLAFRASHPIFMKYLDEHKLNEAEINYVCLYAIGLRGKEIGEYIELKRHYHMSTDIRKKLGLKENDTNLGLHIRKLIEKL